MDPLLGQPESVYQAFQSLVVTRLATGPFRPTWRLVVATRKRQISPTRRLACNWPKALTLHGCHLGHRRPLQRPVARGENARRGPGRKRTGTLVQAIVAKPCSHGWQTHRLCRLRWGWAGRLMYVRRTGESLAKRRRRHPPRMASMDFPHGRQRLLLTPQQAHQRHSYQAGQAEGSSDSPPL